MAADNNLSVDMAYAMEQIKGVAGDDSMGVNLFVYYDGRSPAIPTLYCDFSDHENPRHIRSFVVQDKLYPVESKHDENAADARSVINFVDWCVNKAEHNVDGEIVRGRKADRYAVIFSGHSMGFQDIGLFKDETSDQAMGMDQMNDLLLRITDNKAKLEKQAAGVITDPGLLERETTEILGKPIDILGFDSCVMSMFEVGSQFSEVATTMVASEGSVPSAGWTYAKILGSLACRTENEPVNDIVANFVSEFVRSQDSYTIGGVSVDMAAWDLSRLDGLNKEFEKLAGKILECFEETDSTIYRQMERSLLQVHWKCQSYMLEQSIDLGDFCDLLGEECVSLMKEIGGDSVTLLEEIEKHCIGVKSELAKAVILGGFSGGKYQYSNGISLFFPWSVAAYDVSRENYESLRFVRETAGGKLWNQFLNKYLRDITLRRALPPTDIGTEPGPIILEANIPDYAGEAELENAKLRYFSYQYKDISDDAITKIGGENTKFGGQEGTKFGGQEGTKFGGQEGTKFGGQEGTKFGGQEGTKFGGQEGTKFGGQEGTKFGGQENTKFGGQEGTKFGGQEGTKFGGQEGTKFGGQEGTKFGGQEGTKFGGHEGSKLGAGGNAFFDSFKHFKNIETPWNLSGFTKKPRELYKKKKSKGTTT